MKFPDEYHIIDFETKDPYISRGYGAGWVFALNHDMEDFKVLGMGVFCSKTDTYTYITDFKEMRKVITSAKDIVFHNALYDVGCMLVVMGKEGLDLSQHTFHDTMIFTKLYRQDLMSYGLDAACKRFNLAHTKDSSKLLDHVWNSGLYQQVKKAETGRNIHKRPSDDLVRTVVMQNLDLIDAALVGEYCIADLKATKALLEFVVDRIDQCDLDLFSDLIKVAVKMRKRGVRVDLNQARKVEAEILKTEEDILREINATFNIELNLNSPYQLADFLESRGVPDYPRTDKGNPSISTDYLKSLDDPWAQKVAEARTANKMRTSFIEKIVSYQGFNGTEGGAEGIMYTTLNILGAVRTGRFTSGGGGSKSFELNIQQIPSARTPLGKMCRSVFLPNKGEEWVSGDFSNQEPRIQVHYAVKLNCTGARDIATSWTEDPTASFHLKVAGFTGLPKQEAKVINLGLSYGMGEAKLCESLGLPTKMKTMRSGHIVSVAGPEGKKILNTYHKMLPFMKEVIQTTNNHFRTQGYIRTLGGRKLKINPYFEGDWRKGFSKLVQGSAADQTMRALVACDKAGLDIINTVHDEINISSKDPAADKEILRQCMEDALPVVVPMHTEIAIGPNWAEAKGDNESESTDHE